jgi:hypothetical protein
MLVLDETECLCSVLLCVLKIPIYGKEVKNMLQFNCRIRPKPGGWGEGFA